LISLFALVTGGVPVVQVMIEWRHGGRIQALDLVRYPPRAENLRRYERGLEARCWVPVLTRPMMREMLFELLRDPGQEALLGQDDWLFYRPGVRYLAGSVRKSTALLDGLQQEPTAANTWQNTLLIIREFREQLQERGIELLVVPVPGKASIHPDRLTSRYEGASASLRSPTEDFIDALRDAGVEVVDLFTVFRQARVNGMTAYLEQDTHWTPEGAELAAQTVGDHLRALGWIGTGTKHFELREARVLRHGDIVEMTGLSGMRRRYRGQMVTCRQVVDAELGALIPSQADRPGTYRDPRGGSRVLVLGDSYSRVYQYAEPRTLGAVIEPEDLRVVDAAMAARLLPGSAGFIAHLARVLAGSVDALVSDGGAATDVRQRLSVDPEILEAKSVVIWQFAERDLGLSEWERVPLPQRLDGGR
jgi:hypothetical protein